MRVALLLALAAAILACCRAEVARATLGPRPVHFSTEDGGEIHAEEYGAGDHAVVLAHGARFDKESWSAQARALADAGLRVLALDFRGYGASRGGSPSGDRYAGLELDVLGAVRHLRGSGAREVSVVGGSMGGWAAGLAATREEPREDERIDRLVLLAAGGVDHPERMAGSKLFLCAAGDAYGDGSLRLEGIRDQYARAPEPKRLVVVEGEAHAQHLFASDQGARVLDEILRFLDE